MKLAIIGAGEFQLPLVLKAKELGYETHVFAWESGAVAKEHADFFYPLSITEKEKILEILKVVRPDGVASICSEVAMPTVAYVAEALNLPTHSYQSAVQTLNKSLMKNKFLQHNVSCARGVVINESEMNQLKDLNYSSGVVVKPIDRSGSLAVEIVYDADEAHRACLKAINESFARSCLIEEYISGQEYSVETISFKGEHRILAITKKQTTALPFFVEKQHTQSVEIQKLQEMVKEEVVKSLNSLEITQGVSHVELKINSDEVKIIEVGGRMGGDYIGTHLVRLSTGLDLIRSVIQLSTGRFDWDEVRQTQVSQSVGVYFLCNEHSTEKVLLEQSKKKLERKIIEEELKKTIGQAVEKTTSSQVRFGHLIYVGEELQDSEVFQHFGIRFQS